MYEKIVLSSLNKTWVLDIDGTIVKHNGYLLDGQDTLLPGAKEFLDTLPTDDMIIFLTSRKKEQAELTEKFLDMHRIRYDTIIYEVPYGERILINDKKPSGLETAIAVNTERDIFFKVKFEIDEKI
jgi:ribonucleotide monophosphatase NagD (HAD superfamily)